VFPSSSDSPFLVLWHFFLLFTAVVLTFHVIFLGMSGVLQWRTRSLTRKALERAQNEFNS